MNATTEYVTKIKNLSVPEKILIVEEIWDSIATNDIYPELSKIELSELEERISAYHTNPQGRTWNEIKSNFWQQSK